MKGSIVVLGNLKGRNLAARLVDGRLDDLLIDPDDGAAPAPGTIFRAICDRPVKGQGGMFLRLPEGSAFLRGASGLRPGQSLLVQVTSFAEAGKAVPVTTRVLFKSRYSIVTPDAAGLNISRSIRDEETRVRLHDIASALLHSAEGPGLIIRSAAASSTDADIADDIRAMRDLAVAVMRDGIGSEPELLVDGPDSQTLAWRDWEAPDNVADDANALAQHGICEMIAEMSEPRVSLPGGAHAWIEPTRALVAVDVNTGGDTSPAAGLKANISLARDLPRLLRCRGLGGQITVDFAPQPKKERRQLEAVLRAAFKTDPIETALVGWTQMGNFEMQRKRERLPLRTFSP